MKYNRLGRSGLKVSELSLGSWVTFGTQVDTGAAAEAMAVAYDAGVNFFDNAEVYAGGESERIMGEAFRRLGWDRESFVVSSKFFWGITQGVNTKNTLNRKYLISAVNASLDRFGLDYLDLIFCHRSDPETPIEETVFTMHELVASHKALYWGTSEWNAEEIRAAYEIAERHHLHKPVMEQPQYNMFYRERVEVEYRRLYEDYGMGLTTWSPLASGLLSGKYIDGVPEGSRASLPGYEWLRASLTDPEKNRKVRELKTVADSLDCTLSQLAIAWCTKNPNVSTVITGASSPQQVRENMVAAEVATRLDDTFMTKIDHILGSN
ncbi:voltage-dependent potassium channel beta subunit, animal [Ferrithrix thermotolerans DSM 19514]|uniref:Voltage-dependent potassium channel beta subunit, animal n=1 Tax=Ferrithrix thermotolerans DSM 19514 TaxID=1121881 RepID=A0A1M4XZZ0_9ACTN|nr:aldo/keto reductase [Ferrithrix thermotolerans]SHE99061.1 voltage-dependent potassium channel beta subunit, animal [Ferrithrix thermotolerans DSM 19514]